MWRDQFATVNFRRIDQDVSTLLATTEPKIDSRKMLAQNAISSLLQHSELRRAKYLGMVLK